MEIGQKMWKLIQTYGRTDRQTDSYIPPQTMFAWGINIGRVCRPLTYHLSAANQVNIILQETVIVIDQIYSCFKCIVS